MKDKLTRLFHHANCLMLKRDLSEIKCNVSEYFIISNLKEAISCLLPYYGLNGYYADIEYTNTEEEQTLAGRNPNSIVCDLIVHSRGERDRQAPLH